MEPIIFDKGFVIIRKDGGLILCPDRETYEQVTATKELTKELHYLFASPQVLLEHIIRGDKAEEERDRLAAFIQDHCLQPKLDDFLKESN